MLRQTSDTEWLLEGVPDSFGPALHDAIAFGVERLAGSSFECGWSHLPLPLQYYYNRMLQLPLRCEGRPATGRLELRASYMMHGCSIKAPLNEPHSTLTMSALRPMDRRRDPQPALGGIEGTRFELRLSGSRMQMLHTIDERSWLLRSVSHEGFVFEAPEAFGLDVQDIEAVQHRAVWRFEEPGDDLAGLSWVREAREARMRHA